MEIRTLLTKRNFTKMNNKKNDFIVVHYVGAVSSALANAKYFEKVYRGASAHYFVDDKDCYQVVREGDASWHCGAKHYKHLKCRNSNSIGIEMCCFRNSKGELDISEDTINTTAELVKELMAKYNIPIENVIRHYDVTGKNCPAPLVRNNNRWIDFINRVKVQAKTKYQAGRYVEIDLPVQIAHDNGGDKLLVADGYTQFWVNRNAVKNGKIHERVYITLTANKEDYTVKLFEDLFWVKEKFIIKEL